MGNSSKDHNSRAYDEFLEREIKEAGHKARSFSNAREAILDVLFELEREYGDGFAKRLKKRALEARSMEEVNIVVSGVRALAEFGYSVEDRDRDDSFDS